ncbi:MAG: T9SS type A sorting domain-containing protein [Candidatus Latescibacteria bacterium]|nr:T9SS type A sorting domain-containing protein [Candidatus Latescibacterota bacterium]
MFCRLLFLLVPLIPHAIQATSFTCASFELPSANHIAAAKALADKPRPPLMQERLTALVIWGQFADQAAGSIQPPSYAEKLFDPDLPGSLAHFYGAMSGGQLHLDGHALARRYAGDRTASAYLADEPGGRGQFGRFALEVLARVDADIDLARFDNDGPDGVPNSGDDDGWVDYIFLNMQTVPRDFLRGGATGMVSLGFEEYQSGDLSIDGRPIRISGNRIAGAISGEGTFSQTVGVMAHEFAHSLGLPDLYDLAYDGPEDDSAGIGNWGLMGRGAHGWHGNDGPNPFCVWSLEKLGWLGLLNDRLVTIDQDIEGLPLEDIRQRGQAYKIPLPPRPFNQTRLSEEYLLVERRSPDSGFYDRAMPGDGVLVWHIHPQLRQNRDEENKAVDLVCADGLFADAGYPLGVRPNAERGRDNLDFWAHDGGYAKKHGGNLGDATDLFDGRRFARLSLDTNPSTDPRGLLSAAASGLHLDINRQGDQIKLDVRQPRWAGTIDTATPWAGTILVDGDLEVGPQGGLLIHPGTRVLIGSTDRLASGVDPGRIELSIRGDFEILQPRRPPYQANIVFASQDPGADWFGIALDPEASSRVLAPPGSYSLQGAIQGLYFPGAPPGNDGQLQISMKLDDRAGLETVGNADGQPGPGELFHLDIGLANWSLSNIDKVTATVRWSSHLLKQAQPSTGRVVRAELDRLAPGSQQTFALPLLHLDPAAPAATKLAIVVDMRTSSDAWSDTLSLVVTGHYPDHVARFIDQASPLGASSMRLAADEPGRVQARIEGTIERASLVLTPTVGPQDSLGSFVIPMQQDGALFSAALPTLKAGLYQNRLRLSDPTGATVFSPTQSSLWITPHDELPALVLIDESYSSGQQRLLGEQLDADLAAAGETPQILLGAPPQASFYHAFLPHYAETGGLVVWLGRSLAPEARDLFRAFLEGGGRLLAASYELSTAPEVFLEEVFHFRRGPTPSIRQISGDLFAEDLRFSARHNSLDLIHPARSLLTNSAAQTAGLILNTGTYRLAYLPFSLVAVPGEKRRLLLESTLSFLTGPDRQATLQAAGGQQAGAALLTRPAQAFAVQLQADTQVERAELIVRSLPGRLQVATLPMERVASQEPGNTFSALVELAEEGRYELTVDMRTKGDQRLFSSATLPVMNTHIDGSVLLVLDEAYTRPQRESLSRFFGAALDSLGLEKAEITVDTNLDEAFYQAIFNHFKGPDKAVLWLGDINNGGSRDALQTFLATGGRLYLAAPRLHTSLNNIPFLNNWLHTQRAPTQAWSPLQLIDGGTPVILAEDIRHTPLHIRPPAVPLLLDDLGTSAGLWVDAGDNRLIYLALDLAALQPETLQLLIQSTLPLLLNSRPLTQLDAPGQARHGHTVLAAPDRPVPIRLQTDAAAAQLDVFGLPDLQPVARLPMSREGPGLFTAAFTPPRSHQRFLLAPRLGQIGSPTISGSASLQVEIVAEDDGQPILVFLDQDYNQVQLQRIKTDLGVALDALQLQARVLERAPQEPALYHLLLSQYLDSGKAVVWAGNELEPEAQAAFRWFVESGGNLLMASYNMPRSQQGPEFLRTLFRIRDLGRVARTFFATAAGADHPTFDMRYREFELLPGAEPLIEDIEHIATGTRITTSAYRAVYLPFNLKYVESNTLQEWLDRSLAFIGKPSASNALPRLARIIGPPTAQIPGEVLPGLVVINDNDQDSPPFRLGYQIIHGDRLLATVEQRQPALSGSTERTVELPPWTPPAGAADYHIRFALGPDGDAPLTYQMPRPLHLVAVANPFVEVDFPEDESRGNGAGFFDYDSDGDLDLYLVRLGVTNHLYRNTGGIFSEQGMDAGVADPGRGRGLALGDWDGDGDLDLYLVNEGPNQLFGNAGNGTFAPFDPALPQQPSLADSASGRSAGFFDYDSDGDLDLYLVNAGGPNRLYRNERTGFAEIAEAVGLADAGDGRGLALGDLDDDGDPDLFVANRSRGSRLYRNDGDGFVDAGGQMQLAGGEAAAIFGDLDDDGDLDLFVSNEQRDNQLYRNDGQAGFALTSNRDSLYLGANSVGAAFYDYDNDGDLDLATTALNQDAGGDQLYENRQPYWVPIGALLDLRPASDGRALSFADYDTDGDLDLLVADFRGSRLYRNRAAANNWLEVELSGTRFNRHGIGARVELFAGDQRQSRELQSSFGYGSQIQPRLHFGLGNGPPIDSLLVRWPDGARSAVAPVQSGQRLRLVHPANQTAISTAADLPESFLLESNYPNPFNGRTTISYRLPHTAAVRLDLYNAAGQLVRRLLEQEKHPPGRHQISWDGLDRDGRSLASGVYFYRLDAGSFRQTRRLLLVK